MNAFEGSGRLEMSLAHIWRKPLPYQAREPLTRVLCRLATTVSKHALLDVHGDTTLLAPERDPFVVVFNHNQRLEALIIPSLVFFWRHGKPVHFLADWNFMLIPPIGLLYRRARSIVITRKSAKPKFFNRFKRFFEEGVPPFERAKSLLIQGGSVGIFPEGTVNRDPFRLMRGLPGAARLACAAQVPVVPIGIRFPNHDSTTPIPDRARMSLYIGRPLHPPSMTGPFPGPEATWDFHARVMRALAEVSGKSWDPAANKRRKYVP